MSLKTLLKEFKQVSEDELILTPKDRLFHGTVEEFEPEQLRGGGYDNVLWTTTSSLVAQTYIPVSPSEIFVSTKSFIRPNKGFEREQAQLDIVFKDVKYDEYNRLRSYTPPPVLTFPDVQRRNDQIWKRISATNERQEKDKIVEDLVDIEKLSMDYVNDKLKELGYEPHQKSNYNEDHQWRLKISGFEIMPADYRVEGRLFILEPKQDLKLYDLTFSEKREPDLTDTDYHLIDLFERKQKEGYDGIKITDFAQVETQGNVGHFSYGIFKSAIKKLNIFDIIKVVHPDDFSERSWKKRTIDSKEYEDYLNTL